MTWRTCEYCGAQLYGEGEDSDASACFRCWELFDEVGGPQLDPAEHERATEVQD
jgi:hypothetical protein